jgi:retron-type reverse transcriptase
VLDADIEACFDTIEHAALLDRVRARVKDKRELGLVKAFLKAGVLRYRWRANTIPNPWTLPDHA